MSTWDEAFEAADKDSSDYIKFKNNGDEVQGFFYGPISLRYSKYLENEKKSITSKVKLPGFKLRFKSNFIVNNNGTCDAKIIEMSGYFLSNLKEVFKEYETRDMVIKIKRVDGNNGIAEYKIFYKDKLTEDKIDKFIQGVELHDLEWSNDLNEEEVKNQEGAERPPIPTDMDYSKLGAPKGFEEAAQDINF